MWLCAGVHDSSRSRCLALTPPLHTPFLSLYVLFLGRNASDNHALHASGHRRVGAAELGLRGDAGLGRSVARLGMVDADLVEDLAVGVHYDVPLGGLGDLDNAGGALVLFLTAHTYPHPPPLPPPSAPRPPAPPLDTWVTQLLLGHNSRRADHCAPELVWDASLAESAMAHAMRCPAPNEPSAAAAERRVGESLAVGSFHTTAAGVAAAWYSEVTYYAQYGDEPHTWVPAGRVDSWGRFAQMVWVGSTRLGCGYTTNCTGGVPHWVCHYAEPGLGEGEFVANVRPNNGDRGCALSPSPPSPPPPIASPPPNFPPFGKGGLTDTASSISNPDEQGGNTKMTSAAVAAIVLGMGMTTTAVYITVSALIVPSLEKLDVLPMAAHLFAFYFGVVSTITPPVALAAFAGAAIAKTPPMATAVESARVGIAKYLVPFAFVYNPSLLFDGSIAWTIYSALAAVAGLWLLSASLESWLYGPLNGLMRLAVFAAAVLALMPPTVDILGIPGVILSLGGLALGATVAVMRRRDPVPRFAGSKGGAHG